MVIILSKQRLTLKYVQVIHLFLLDAASKHFENRIRKVAG